MCVCIAGVHYTLLICTLGHTQGGLSRDIEATSDSVHWDHFLRLQNSMCISQDLAYGGAEYRYLRRTFRLHSCQAALVKVGVLPR